MKRCNHYEVAFESYLRSRTLPYMAVSEARRSLLASGETVKNLDFVVSVPESRSWLVDIKGRLFPAGSRPQYWKQWSTWDDLVGMKKWETLFGSQFSGLFVFAFLVCGRHTPVSPEHLFLFRKRYYAFLAVSLDHYLEEARLISPKWNTYALPTKRFRQLAKPFDILLPPSK